MILKGSQRSGAVQLGAHLLKIEENEHAEIHEVSGFISETVPGAMKDDATDGRNRAVDLTLPGGSVIRTVDMLPGTSAPMHRTSSLDYGIVISGSIELLLDDGAATLCNPGDIVIQRGTIHAWRNPSATETARIAFVLLDAKPVTVNGAPLPDIHPSGRRQP